MARAAVKAKQQAKQKAQPKKAAPSRRGGGRRKHASGGNPNQQLFFMKLRRRAKFVYVLLAVLFAITFAFLGVGSGSSGLDQLFSNLNIFGGGGGNSVSKAQKHIKEHPNAAPGYRELATAYESPLNCSVLMSKFMRSPRLGVGRGESNQTLRPRAT